MMRNKRTHSISRKHSCSPLHVACFACVLICALMSVVRIMRTANAYMYSYMCAYMRPVVYMCPYMSAVRAMRVTARDLQFCVHVYMHIYVHTHTHAHTHTHTHTHTPSAIYPEAAGPSQPPALELCTCCARCHSVAYGQDV